jgi:FtsP/CotA-like multicopper oxidase with cupredoxin domain
MSRRRFIGLGAGAAVGAPLPGLRRALGADGSLREPPLLRSRDGLLRVTLTAERRRCVVAGEERDVVLYNGTLPGPTLVADPGDRIEVRLVNRLDEPTNLHTHGLHITPEGNADNPFVHVAPGESFDYAFDIPRDHSPGCCGRSRTCARCRSTAAARSRSRCPADSGSTAGRSTTTASTRRSSWGRSRSGRSRTRPG